MAASSDNPSPPPDARTLRKAVRIYLDHAYPQGAPPAAEGFMPPAGADIADWLMGDLVERTAPADPFDRVRSFALRIGNQMYPHMKLRLSRVGARGRFVLTVDSHDAFLCAEPGGGDEAALESLQRHNASVVSAAVAAMDAAGLPTERNFLREQIRRAKGRKEG